MLRSLKVPILVSLAIVIIFVFQGFMILTITKDGIAKDSVNLLKLRMEEIKDDPKSTSLVYEQAILDKNYKIISSNLTFLPSNFNFRVLKDRNFIYYKDYAFYGDDLYFLIVAKNVNYSKLKFISFITFLCTIIVVFYVTKLTYKSVTLPFLEKNKMLNTFFNDAMHELKTPLGVASINLEMLEFRDKHTHRIKGALRQMKVAYEDVEYFIKNERVNFPKEIINFSEFLRDRIRFSSTIANVKKISIEEFIADGLEIYMSKVEATRLVDNNLSNALKYSHPNSIIKVELVKDKNSASFSVEDFGIGIKDSAKIWSRFQREDTTRGGFGLGLNIVLKICQKYAINYSVDSVYQKGSKFTYKIPLYKELLLDNIG